MTAGTRPGPGSPQEEEAVAATTHLTTATETHTTDLRLASSCSPGAQVRPPHPCVQEEGDTDPAPVGVIMVETALPHTGTLKNQRPSEVFETHGSLWGHPCADKNPDRRSRGKFLSFSVLLAALRVFCPV
nr:uncharacterized protein LOC105097371 isoform X1 [Camelus dromedarius]